MTIDERVSRELKQHLPEIDEQGVWGHIEAAANATRRRRTAVIAIASTVAVVLVVVGMINFLPPDQSLPVAQGQVPFEQMATIRQVVRAVNERDAESLIEAFTPTGSFDPRGTLDKGKPLLANWQAVDDEAPIHVWMTIIDAWSLEVELKECHTDHPPAGSSHQIVCEVATRWHTLSIEIAEAWTFDFSGPQVRIWDYRLVDLNPPERALPFGYALIEEWEAWLRQTNPLSANQYLNRRIWEDILEACDGCQEFQDSLAPGNPVLAAKLAPLMYASEKYWKVDGFRWYPDGLIPYDSNLADEIEASINEYLETK
jgi:hypothetical protein